MHLTAAGELFINHIRRHIAESQRVQSEIDRLRGMQQGQVAVAVSPALATDFVPGVLRNYRRQYPGISLVVRVVQHEIAMHLLLNFDVDLAIVIAPPKHPDVFDLAVVKQPLLAAMHTDHPLAEYPGLRLSDVIQYPLILPSVGLTTREKLDAVLQPFGRDVKIAAETNSYEVMLGLLPETEQIGFVVSTGFHLNGKLNSIVYRPIMAQDLHPVPVICAQLRNRGLSVAAAKFSELIIQEMENIN
jgi:DNA-binding transcriptional LysR family regulator